MNLRDTAGNEIRLLLDRRRAIAVTMRRTEADTVLTIYLDSGAAIDCIIPAGSNARSITADIASGWGSDRVVV